MSPTASRRLKLAIPWVLSIACVAYIVESVDLEQVRQAFLKADLWTLLVLLVVFMGVIFVADAATLVLLFRRFLGPISFKDVLAIKGVSYFFNAINYSAASGGMALFLKKKKAVPFLQGLSSLLWLNFVDVLALVLMLTGGFLFAADLLPAEHRRILPWLLVAFGCVSVGALIYWNLGFDFFVLGRLRSWRIFDAFRRATVRDYAVMITARVAFIFLYVLLTWSTLPCFHTEVGIGALLVYVPVLTFVQIVPASISGLGAVQEVQIAFFGAYVLGDIVDPRSQIFAFTLVVGPFMTLLRMGLGYFFVANITRDFLPKADEIAAARAAEDAT